MTVANLVLRLNGLFQAKRVPALWCLGFALAGCLAAMFRLEPSENIAFMIPDNSPRLAEDFRLLQKAPFSGRLFIDVASPVGTDPDIAVLARTGDAVAAALPRELFGLVRGGPQTIDPAALTVGLVELFPALSTPEDIAQIEAMLTPEAVSQAIRECARALSSPEGMGMKNVIRKDPLGFRKLVLAKLASLRLSQTLRLNHGRFISEDGRHMLLMALPKVPMTDSRGAAQITSAFESARSMLPPGYTATLVGGHRHTQANTSVIRSDMATVLAASLAGLALLFLTCLRSRAGLLAFLVPLVVLPPAAVATRLVFGSISGITLGFGSVLMGVAADYSIYVYFALHALPGSPRTALARVSAPVWYGAATSLACFSSLLLSGMPGVRELAFFSIIGLSLALLLALVVLPSFIHPERSPRPTARDSGFSLSRRSAFILTALVLTVGACFGVDVHFDSDLRSLSASTQDLKREEESMRAVWGDVRDRAIVFAKGATLDDCLSVNRGIYLNAFRNGLSESMITLAPILPPLEAQEDSIARWRALFTPKRVADLKSVLEAEAAAQGFTPDAFAPFWKNLEAVNIPRSMPEKLRSLGLGEAVDLLFTKDGDAFLAMSIAGNTPDADALERGLEGAARIISQSSFGRELTAILKADFLRFIGIALVGNLILLLAFIRPLSRAILSFLPVAAGLALLFGVLGAADIPLNLFGVIAVPLVIGIGVDYGIFVAMAGAGRRQGVTTRAVVVAGLSTVAGFGALALARHPALHSIGVTVLVGISGAVLSACLLVAPLGRRE